ncbi:MAG: GntR family transcriptional regulator [Polyangiaceae bacterium]
MFEPLPPRASAVDACVDTIRRAILLGELHAGEKLPPERRLAESLGVNRTTLRQALGRLTHAQLVEPRQGSGYAVRDYRQDGGPDLLAGLASLADGPRALAAIVEDLLLVRRHLARAVLERLASREAVDLEPLEQAVEAFAEVAAAHADAPRVAAADLAILQALLAATESPVLALCFNPVARALRDIPILAQILYARPEDNLAGWRLLLAWLQSPDSKDPEAVVKLLAERDAASLSRLTQSRLTQSHLTSGEPRP